MSNTLNLGAGIWGTKEDSLLAYNSENGNYKPLPFDFTRASSATVVNKAGLIETVQSGIPRIDFLGNTNGALLLEPQRTNLITQSEAFGNSYWTKSGSTIQGDPSTAGSELITNGDFATDLSGWNTLGSVTWDSGSAKFNGGTQDMYQEVLTQDKMYEITYDWTRTSGILEFYAGNLNQANVVTSGSSGTETFMATAYAGVGVPIPKAEFYSTNFIGTIDNVSVKEVQGFTSPSADSPLNAFKLVEDSATSGHRILKILPFTAGSYTQTIYAKQAERSVLQIFLGGQHSGTAYANFDLSNGTIPNSAVLSASITALANGWYKCSVTFTAVTTASEAIYYSLSDSVSMARAGSYTGDGTSGLYIYGAQLEQSSYPTSYIPTQGSTVTVVGETCSGAGNDQVINSTEGVLYADVNFKTFTGQDYFGLNDGTNTQRVLIEKNGTNVNCYVGSVTLTSSISSLDNKIAVKWKLNDFKMYINGVEVSNITSGTVPIGLNRLDFKIGGGLGLLAIGDFKDVKVFDTALTDSELIALTT